jgi:hypothetical protein
MPQKVDVEQYFTGVVESRPVVLETLMRSAIVTILIGLTATVSHAQTKLPPGYWTEAKSAEILAKTEVIRLDTPLDALSDAERSAMPELLEVGALMQKLYERSRHAEAPTALSQLTSDAEFSRYLRNRARDLVSGDYEAGDASWVTGRFAHLNAQIGSYETYDDALYGVKAFHSMSILLRDEAATEQLRKALGGLQAIEDALPYEKRKRVREDIPVGVYDVIADFGQARGINTATILPNDALFSRRYGRTLLLRANLMKNPVLFASDERVWRAATTDTHANDLAPEGNLQRTLWHEVGHYLGPDRDQQGRTLDDALANYADAMEEMKSDLVSLFALHRMQHPSLRAIQASGIRRTLQNVKPRTDQPYQTMQLVQFNWFLDRGLLRADPVTARLTVDYDRYPDSFESLLKEVLRLQYSGDQAAVGAFFQQWTTWKPELHEKLAERIRAARGVRFRIVRYRVLGE